MIIFFDTTTQHLREALTSLLRKSSLEKLQVSA